MKPTSKDNTVEVIAAIFIGAAALGLTYLGNAAFPDSSQSTALERVLALPMFATVFIFEPHTSFTGYVPIIMGWVGSIVAYAAIGTGVWCAVQSWLKKRRSKKDKDTRI